VDSLSSLRSDSMNIHVRIIFLLAAAKTCGSLSKRSEAVNQKNTGQAQRNASQAPCSFETSQRTVQTVRVFVTQCRRSYTR
jgi:hypothetical protein